jgi:hypothetical protein
MDYFLAGNPAIFSFHTNMESIWNVHGIVHSIWIPWTGPCGFHGISNEFVVYKLQIHVLFHKDSMEQSIWIPWNSSYEIPWKNTIQCVVKNGANHEN